MADSYQTLVQAAVPTTVGQIGSAVPAAKNWIVQHWVVVNTNANGTLTVTMYKNGTVAANQITGVISIPAGGHLEFDGEEAMAAGEYFAGLASGPGLVFTVSGDQVG